MPAQILEVVSLRMHAPFACTGSERARGSAYSCAVHACECPWAFGCIRPSRDAAAIAAKRKRSRLARAERRATVEERNSARDASALHGARHAAQVRLVADCLRRLSGSRMRLIPSQINNEMRSTVRLVSSSHLEIAAYKQQIDLSVLRAL